MPDPGWLQGLHTHWPALACPPLAVGAVPRDMCARPAQPQGHLWSAQGNQEHRNYVGEKKAFFFFLFKFL